jgi:diaminohydroxyphosphoribosylaminopyrimidine deaminase/5-amino-6-(5-phosphoribosylamino)uracil reductase
MNLAFLHETLHLARQGLGQTSPNPAVGAVVEKDGVVVGRGFHTYAGVKHAEVLAIEQAGEQAKGSTLYINLEPCSHQGRTGPCSDAVILAGVRRVVAAMEDPNPLVSGRGFQRLRDAGVDVFIIDELRAEAEQLNEPFVHFMRYGRPLATLKAALTLDGKIAAPDDNEGWITSETARSHVQQVRHLHDAICTGIGTVLADDCLLTDRTGLPRSRPLLRIVVDSQLRIPMTSKMVQSAASDLLLVTTSASHVEKRAMLENHGVRVAVLDGPQGRTNLNALVEYLAREQVQSLMFEGGSKLNWAVLEADVVDKVLLYYGAKILGGTQSLPMAGGTGRRRRKDAIRVRNVKLHSVAPDEFAVEAYVHRDY